MAKFTKPEIKEAIIQSLLEGNFEAIAADYAGVSRAAYYLWLRRGEEEYDDPDSEYAQFYKAVKKAKAEAVKKAVRVVVKAGENGDWGASKWWLSKAYPELYGEEWRNQRLNPKDREEDDDFVIDLSEGDKDENNPSLPGD